MKLKSLDHLIFLHPLGNRGSSKQMKDSQVEWVQRQNGDGHESCYRIRFVCRMDDRKPCSHNIGQYNEIGDPQN